MLRYGNITEVDPAKGLARVHFDDVDIISGWLPVLSPRTHSDAESDPMEEGEHVACVMDKHDENGVILGAMYSSKEKPPEGVGKDVWLRKFKDGTIFKYDRAAHVYSVTMGTTEFKINKTGGFSIKKGSESLDGLINDLITQISLITVTAAGSPSSTPINATAINLIKGRVTSFFSA
jgi:phage baseplate assembly protein V